MTTSVIGISLIRSEEECILHPYLDIAGVPTIGWGTTMYKDGKHVTLLDPSITQMVADDLLNWRVALNDITLSKTLHTVVVTQSQFDALSDFVYNEGFGHLYSSTLLRLILTDPSNPGIPNAFLMWDKYHKDGQLLVSSDLYHRRQTEIKLYNS